MPVRPWAVRYIEDLYAKNEHVVLNGTWQGGWFSMAARRHDVGSIDLVLDEADEPRQWSIECLPEHQKQKRSHRCGCLAEVGG
jgi:hypothetical protein